MKKAIIFLSLAALSAKAAWGPLPGLAAQSKQAPATHSEQKITATHSAQKIAMTHSAPKGTNVHASLEIHPKVRARLEEKKKEVPASVQKTIGTKKLQAIQTAARIQNFPLADLVTFWFLERTNDDGKNTFMFEDDTFCENFLKLHPQTIDRIGTYYSKAKANEIRRIIPKNSKSEQTPTLTASLKAAILPFKNDACIASCVLARFTRPMAEQFAVQAQNVGAPSVLCDPGPNFWLVHNWGRFISQDIVEDWYKPIVQIVGRSNLIRRGFPAVGSALSYRYNLSYYYSGIRKEVADVLQANGYDPESGRFCNPNKPHSRNAINGRAMAHRAFTALKNGQGAFSRR